jgi:hypothetical protein
LSISIEEVGSMIFTDTKGCGVEDGCIKLVPIQRSRKEELEQLLSAITVDNLHHVDFFCDEVGDEAW